MRHREPLRRTYALTLENVRGVVQVFAATGGSSMGARSVERLKAHFHGPGNLITVLNELAREGTATWERPPAECAKAAVAAQLWVALGSQLQATWDELALPALDGDAARHEHRLYLLLGRDTEAWAESIPTFSEDAPLDWVHLGHVEAPDFAKSLVRLGRFLPEVGSDEIYMMIQAAGGKAGLRFEKLADLLGFDEGQTWENLREDESARNVFATLLSQWVEAGELRVTGSPNDPIYRINWGPAPGNAADVFLEAWPWSPRWSNEPKGVTEIAGEARLSKGNVSDHLATLEKAGVLKRVKRQHGPNGTHPVPRLVQITAKLSLLSHQVADARLTVHDLLNGLRDDMGGDPFSKLREDLRWTFLRATVDAGLITVTGRRVREGYASGAIVSITHLGWATIQGCPACQRPLRPGDLLHLVSHPNEKLAGGAIQHENCAGAKSRVWTAPPAALSPRYVEARLEQDGCTDCGGSLWKVTTRDGLESYGISGGAVGAALRALARYRAIAKGAPAPREIPTDPTRLLDSLATERISPQQRAALLRALVVWLEDVDLAARPNQRLWLETIASLEKRYHRMESGLVHSYAFSEGEHEEHPQKRLADMVWRVARSKRKESGVAFLGQESFHHACCRDRLVSDED